MVSQSSRGHGSDEERGRDGGPEAKGGETPRVIRASKPLARPKPPQTPAPEKKESVRTGPLKPGDRLWSKPKKERDRASERRVYLSSQEYEAEHPEPPESPAIKAHRPTAGALPQRVGPARREDRTPGSSKPKPGRPEFRKGGPPKRDEGRGTRGEKRDDRPAFRKEGPPKRDEGPFKGGPSQGKLRAGSGARDEGRKRDDRPAFRKEGPPTRDEGRGARGEKRDDRPAFRKEGAQKGPAVLRTPPSKSARPTDRRPPGSSVRREEVPGKPPRATTPFASVKGNLRAAATRVLFGVLERGGQLKSLVQAEQARFSHEGDRALIREISSGVLRHLSHIDWSLGKAATRGLEATSPELRCLVRVGLYQILFLERVPAYAVVDQCVEAAKSIGPGPAGFVNGVLRTAAEHKEEYREAPFLVAGAEGLSLRYGMPRWLVDRYLVRYGEEEAERLLAALQEPAGAVLFFPDAGRLAQARPLLEREGFLQKPDPAFPLTLHVSGGNPADSEAFRRGLFYVADPASQVPALLLPVAPGDRVLDLCAAPGGKTVVLAGRVFSGGWVLSTDVNRRRILRIEENVARLGLKNVRLAQVDAARALPFGPGWPSVLLDAPCSALGTLRRNPEIRWQIKPEAFPIFADRQHAFLRQAASAVAPGGHLLYSVCTLEREETTEVVERFLAEERSFRPAALEPPPFLAPLLERAGEGAAYCLPHRHGWDGFFVALFRKKN